MGGWIRASSSPSLFSTCSDIGMTEGAAYRVFVSLSSKVLDCEVAGRKSQMFQENYGVYQLIIPVPQNAIVSK